MHLYLTKVGLVLRGMSATMGLLKGYGTDTVVGQALYRSMLHLSLATGYCYTHRTYIFSSHHSLPVVIFQYAADLLIGDAHARSRMASDVRVCVLRKQ